MLAFCHKKLLAVRSFSGRLDIPPPPLGRQRPSGTALHVVHVAVNVNHLYHGGIQHTAMGLRAMGLVAKAVGGNGLDGNGCDVDGLDGNSGGRRHATTAGIKPRRRGG